MKSKEWLICYFCIVITALCVIGAAICYVDPYFHYHYPHTEKYYYQLSNERYKNDGILKHFTYDAVITGTSMTEQFKTSEVDNLFGTQSIKVPCAGAAYKEINDNLRTALRYHPELKLIIRGLDMNYFFDFHDTMRYELKDYPFYLYNENPIDDVKYLFNRNTMVDVCYMLSQNILGMEPGITSFDEYGAWQDFYTFGVHAVCPDGIGSYEVDKTKRPLSSEEKLRIQENIYVNVISLAEEYPNVTFYYFFTPYSAAWWAGIGSVDHQIAAEQYIIELILERDNIRLYSFNNRTDITTDLNHYKDNAHYAAWINSLMLKWMHDGEYLLTKDNYMDYLEEERAFYAAFDSESLNGQEDYECDDYAAALLNQELCGVEPLNLAMFPADVSDEEVLMDGCRVFVQNIDAYKYLTFYAEDTEGGQILAEIFDEEGEVLAEIAAYDDLGEEQEWRQYLLNISEIKGDVTICLHGSIVDGEAPSDELKASDATLRDVYLY